MTAEFRHGLVIGKFYPPHAGHVALIDGAAARCERVSVVIAWHPSETIALADRVDWLAWECAHRRGVGYVGVIDDHPVDYADPAIWDAHEAVFRAAAAEIAPGIPVDAVSSGEEYGEELARRFDAVHLRTHRGADGPSGTRLRAHPSRYWHDLVPAARQALARRIVVIGAESTGTTTLSAELAAALGTVFVPEYGRSYSAAKLARARVDAFRAGAPAPAAEQLRWRSEEFTMIGARQTAAIDAACLTHPVVVADTDAFATSVWHERYVGGPHAPSLELAAAHRPDLYLLTAPDGIPFEPDGLRDGQHIRAGMHRDFVARLDAAGVPWRLLTGDREERLRRALGAARALPRGAARPDLAGY